MPGLNKKRILKSLYFLPVALFCVYIFIGALSYKLHDFGNSYFPSLLKKERIAPESIIFDIYEFNSYVWKAGYEDLILDFYYNSPFTITAFYPLTFIEDAYVAKAIFNVISCFALMYCVFLLVRMYNIKHLWGLLFIPLVFYIPIKNGLFYGQAYLLVLFLVVYGFYQVAKRKHFLGTSALGFAALLKFFPVFYGIPFLFKRNWKAVWIGILVTFIWIGVAIIHSGFNLWDFYFFDVMPNGMRNGTVMDFRVNSQSFDVFLKTLFVQDSYYNPEAILDYPRLYRLSIWLIKGVILGITIQLSWLKRTELFTLLAIWVVALFLLQSKSASYAQILWIIPAFYLYRSELSWKTKGVFFLLLLFVANFPITRLVDLPVFFRFSRLWFSLGLAIIFFRGLHIKIDWRFIPAALILLLPLNTKLFIGEEPDNAVYVLDSKKHFMIYDYEAVAGKLQYGALGRHGDEKITTSIPINSFEKDRCKLIDNQIYVDGKQLTQSSELKKKPVLVNECEVYYLGDRLSRRGAFTLKKIDICNVL